MPVTKQAKKKLRKDIKRTKANLKIKINFKKTLKKTKKSLSIKDINEANKVIDQASKKGLIHKNKAARLKSSLSHATKSDKTKPPKPKSKK